MRPSDRAWAALVLGILAYQFSAVEGELMSEAMDRYVVAHPWITRVVIAAVALHLSNGLPQKIDPLHGFGIRIQTVVQSVFGGSIPRSTNIE